MSEEWSDSSQEALEVSERTVAHITLLVDALGGWLNYIRSTFAPDNLPDEISSRIATLMYKTEMVKPVLHSDSAGEAFSNLMHWIRDLGPGGIVIEEYHDPEELDEVLLAREQIRLERERKDDD